MTSRASGSGVAPSAASNDRSPRQAVQEDLLRLTQLGEEDFRILRRHAGLTAGWIDAMIEDFYETIYAHQPTQEIFHEGERVLREDTLRSWLVEALSGEPDENFWRRQWIVGLQHVKRHVDTSQVVAMMGRLHAVVVRGALENLPAEEAGRLIVAFRRMTDVVVGLVAAGTTEGYRLAISDVTGMSTDLIERMADVAVDKLLRQAREGVA